MKNTLTIPREGRLMNTRSIALFLSAAIAVSSGACFVCTAADMPYDTAGMYKHGIGNIEHYTGEELVDKAIDNYIDQNPDVEDSEIEKYLGYDSVDAMTAYKKAQTLSGVCFNEDESLYGTFTIKTGAINKRNKSVKVKVTITPLSGKKLTASATMFPDEEGALFGEYKFKSPLGMMYILLYGYYDSDNGIVLSCEGEGENGYFLYDTKLGGAFDTDELYFGVEGDIDFGDDWEPVIDLPDDEPIYVKNGTKFSFDKAPTIKYKKYREDGEVFYELTGLDDENKTNYSALKLTYTAKTGVFKGTFKVYVSNECCSEKAPKLKSYTAKVSGIVVGGEGFGTATIKIGKITYCLNCWISS